MTKALVNKVQELQATVAFLNSKRSILEGEAERLRVLVVNKAKDMESVTNLLANQTRAANNLKAVLDNKDIDIRELELKLDNKSKDLQCEKEGHKKTANWYSERLRDEARELQKHKFHKELFCFFTCIESFVLAILILEWCYNHVRFV